MSKISIILYPRTYNKRGAENLHSVQGITDDGRNVNVKLRVPEDQKDNPFAPSIIEFSRDDIEAKMACQADLKNGPDDRYGMLLFTDCIRTKNKDTETYEAQWATVLAFRKSKPSPLIGLGRISINKETAKINRIHRSISSLESEGKIEDAKEERKGLLNPDNYNYPVIMYYPEDMYSGISTDIDGFKSNALQALSKYDYDGHSPGLMIRLINNKNRVVKDSYFELISRHIGSEGRNQTPFETIDYFVKYIESKLSVSYFKDSSLKLEFIPILRVASAIYSIKFYAQKQQIKFIENHYYSSQFENGKEGAPVLSKIATRVSYSSDYDKMLLSKAYSLSAPLGHPVRLDSKGRFTHLFENEIAKKAQEDVKESDLIESKIGLSFHSIPTRAIWLVNTENNILSTEEKNKKDNMLGALKKNEQLDKNNEFSIPAAEDVEVDKKHEKQDDHDDDNDKGIINEFSDNKNEPASDIMIENVESYYGNEADIIIESVENIYSTTEISLAENGHEGNDPENISIDNNQQEKNKANAVPEDSIEPKYAAANKTHEIEKETNIDGYLSKLISENNKDKSNKLLQEKASSEKPNENLEKNNILSKNNEENTNEKNKEFFLEAKHEEKESISNLSEKKEGNINGKDQKKTTGLAAFMKRRSK